MRLAWFQTQVVHAKLLPMQGATTISKKEGKALSPLVFIPEGVGFRAAKSEALSSNTCHPEAPARNTDCQVGKPAITTEAEDRNRKKRNEVGQKSCKKGP